MTDVRIDDFLLREVPEADSPRIGTPMQRAANQLQRVLPHGWRVEVVEATYPTVRNGQPVLRLLLPED
ncbi:hypothetical protein [Nocardia seriolae]|uniref:Uncharacterized protein n=1 Tax=Nocardia seriolae TaxID=37332 RepID=A0A0B8N809_9NOCA|nr:hypothetical protein [Nocardia seriolae]APA95115.1 hypothetical protein NS506_01041 [Nocardia seriolae]MTJ66784.1 hypothetical protein [Nocardia seriolae]MTJ70417.1 hypothetical protein [Nocardia seriolae]MTJ85380.1 hypothetical protein [Nocardia seriolae]MTK29376.1 hypothetical protein [Nocardia seriolae]